MDYNNYSTTNKDNKMNISVSGNFNLETEHLVLMVDGKRVYDAIPTDSVMFFNVLGLEDESHIFDGDMMHFTQAVQEEWVNQSLEELENPCRG